MIALLTNQLFLVFVVFSVPCLGLLCHFLSPVVLVVSLLRYLYFYSSMVFRYSLHLCKKGKQTSVKGAAVHVFSGPSTEIDKLNRDREIYIVPCCR